MVLRDDDDVQSMIWSISWTYSTWRPGLSLFHLLSTLRYRDLTDTVSTNTPYAVL